MSGDKRADPFLPEPAGGAGWLPAADPAVLARQWAAVVAGTDYLPMEPDELAGFLAGQAARLAGQLDREPADPLHCQQVGAALVAANLTSAEGLGRSIEVLAEWLLAPPATGEPCRRRVAGLLGALATGFAQAVQARTLEEQEAVRRAAWAARAEALAALRESEARFRHQATHDPLTDLANRTMFGERLTELFTRGTGPDGGPRRIGVCFVDLDGFKVINDTLGHHIGDLLLTVVASRLRQHLPGRLIARLGGDEFMILVENPSCADDVVKVADTALAAIAEPISVDGHELSVSASIGIVERETGGTCPGEMMRAADITLQWAKTGGKARWAVFDPDRNERELAQFELSAALPAALDSGQLFLEYEPVVALADGTVDALQALVRWRHPKLGTITPDRFLGAAEETGLIVRLGGWILSEACHQARRWERWSRHPPVVSVQLTSRQLRHPGLVDTVTAALERSGLPPHRLQLEVTESSPLVAGGEPLRGLHQLAGHGVRMALAGFGTGYCDLPHLRSLPVQELKLAGGFLAGLPEQAAARDPGTTADEQILAALVSLAHTLGLRVVAAEVQTAAQAQTLRALGCDAGQGPHFGHPTVTPLRPPLPAGR
jgi:diguanylate cyclase (GGDEF)-like protein